MYEKMKRWVGSLRPSSARGVGGSFAVEDESVIQDFAADPGNTFLVSFPRTGSHWLRMLMELYFGRPSLTRIFFYPERSDYLTLHSHDLDLSVRRSRVLYLYRDPVDTVYSQLRYHREPFHDRDRIAHWSTLYGRHLDKWLLRERFTTRKTPVTFEEMRNDLPAAFARVAGHFGEALDTGRLAEATARVTKEAVKEKTPHDPQAVQLGTSYGAEREAFRADFQERVWACVLRDRPELDRFFPRGSSPAPRFHSHR